MTIETLRAEIRDFVLNDGLIDSIGIMRLLTFLSQTYNIELTDDDFKMKNFESIDNICEFIMRK